VNKDLAFGSAALVLAGGYYLMAAAIPQSLLADAIGPQGLPKSYAVLLAGLSLILIVRSMAGRRAAPRGSVRSAVPVLGRVAGMLAIGVLYTLLVPSFGYLLSLAGLIFATTYCQGGPANRRVALVAVCGAVFLWLLFVRLLGIPQPAGFWPSLL
jgi:hypothetical protein